MPTIQKPSELVFKEETHSYWRDGKRIPGVNEIMKTVGITKDYEGIDPFYANRGKAVHLTIQYFLEGTLDEATIDPQIIPYFEGFKKYSIKHPFKPVSIECKLDSLDHSFAGTIDLVTDTHITDWKCSKSHDRAAEIQGEAYKTLALPITKKILPFRVVQFPGNGDFEIFDYGTGMELWPFVMGIYRWKKKIK